MYPEPVERFVFTVLAISIPIIVFTATLLSGSARRAGVFKQIPHKLDASILVPVIVPTGLLILFSDSDFLARLWGGYRYITGFDYAVLICIAFVSIATAYSKKYAEFFKRHTRQIDITIFPPIIIAIFLLAPFARSDLLARILGEEGKASPFENTVSLLCLFLSVSFCLWKIYSGAPTALVRQKKARYAVWLIFIAGVLLQIFSWRITGVNSISMAFKWSGHADPLFYVLSQIVHGKTVLVDLPSQYGLWAELVAPIFHNLPVSVLGLSTLFAILQLTSLFAIFFVVFKLVKEPALLAMGGIALVVMTFGTTSLFSGIKDPYFQYWPIRSFWPMLSVLGFYIFVQRPTLRRSASFSVLGAISLFWNTDTGLFVVLSFGAFLVSKLIISILNQDKPNRINETSWTPRQFVSAIALHLVITALVIGMLFALLGFKSGAALNFAWLFEYQRIFFGLGFFMLPLPREIHPWISILGIYLLGLLVSIQSWGNSANNNKRMDTIFYLSMLGLGLFAYYQGRSHVLNLVSVCWPAVLIGLILTDESLRAIRMKLLPKIQLALPGAFVVVLCVCCVSFIAHLEYMTYGVLNFVGTPESEHSSSLVADELAFIKERSARGQECLILSRRQGIYHAESGLLSPFEGPSLVEMVLKSDQDHLIAQVKDVGVKCLYLGLGRYSEPGLPLDLPMLEKRYWVVATNSQRTMVYLEPK